MQSRLGVRPSGRSSHVFSQSCFSFAHRAIDLGPSAPVMMAAMVIAMMFSTVWNMLMGVRGSLSQPAIVFKPSNSSKETSMRMRSKI